MQLTILRLLVPVLVLFASVSTTTGYDAADEDPIVMINVPKGIPLKFDRRIRQHLIPSNISTVALKCEANVPILWSLNSLEQDGVDGTQTERLVNNPIKVNFYQPSTYMYSMTVKLRTSGLSRTATQKFICHEAAYRQPSSSLPYMVIHRGPKHRAAVTFEWDNSLESFAVRLSDISTAEVERPESLISNENGIIVGRDESESDLSMFNNFDPYPAELYCCIKPGAHPEAISSHIDHDLRTCSQPLLCLTRNHVGVRSFYTPSNDTTGRGRCSYLKRWKKDDADNYRPSVHNCQLSNYAYTDKWADKMERSFNIFPSNQTFLHLEYKSLLDNTKAQDWTQVAAEQGRNYAVFYVGDLVQFRCQAAPFVYASGIIWEREFQNGSSDFLRGNEAAGVWDTNEVELTVVLSDMELTRISCHVPPWSSINWATMSKSLTILASSKPLSSSGKSFLQQNLTFYVYQSIDLICDFTGIPPPKIMWNSTSEIYRLTENGTIASMSVRYQHLDSTDFPEVEISCFATNVGGSAAKIFSVRALGSMVPMMANSGREAIVMTAGESNRAINCSIRQGLPAPEFHWFRHGVNVSKESELKDANFEIHMGGNGTGALWSSLVFKKVRLEDEAEYVCGVQNFRGHVIKEFSVRIRGDHPSSLSFNVLLGLVIFLICLLIGLIIAFVWITKIRNPTISVPRAEYMKSEEKDSTVTFSTFTDY